MTARRWLRPLWICLALVFVFEAWLWEKLEPVVERIVALIPLERFKAWLREHIAQLSPALTLIVFAIPAIVLFPLKLLGLWLIASKHYVLAGAVIVFAKLVGVGITAFIFDATKPKLLQMAWFRWAYEKVLAGLAWAHRLADPYVKVVRAMSARWRGRARNYAFMMMARLRAKMRNNRAK